MAVTMTYSFLNIAPEFGVNGTATGSQSAPASTRLNNGDLAFAFQSDEALAPSQDVLGRIFTAGGAAISSDFNVQVGPSDLETLPQLAALTNGNFVAVYTDSAAAGGSGTSTAFRLFQPNGTGIGGPILFENETDDQTAPSVAALGDGFVIVHLDQGLGSLTANSVMAQRYNSDGSVNGAVILVASSANGSPIRAPKVTALSDGGFVVVWAADVLAGAGENYDIFAQRFTAAGADNGAQITINAETDNQTSPVVTPQADGGFAVAWEDEENGSAASGNIDFITVSGAGVLGTLYTITRVSRQEQPSIAALTPQIFAISFTTDLNGTQDINTVAANAATGELANLDVEEQPGAQNQPAIVALSNGAFVNAWTDSAGDGSGTRISAQQDRLGRRSVGDGSNELIVLDDLNDTVDGGNGLDTIDGGAGNDLLQGNLAGDSISGGFGNDMIYAMTQADPLGSAIGDTLNGGGGDDLIQGANGPDIINGGDNQDTIDGAGGDDLLQGGLNGDTINGGAGNDTIFANTQVSPDASGVGDLLAGGTGNDTITGSAGADQIFGGAGDDSVAGGSDGDTLYGDGGADTMLGGVGEDKYVINDTTDVVTELPGEGVADTAFVGTDGWTSFAGIEIIRLFGSAISVTGQTGSQQIVANAGIPSGSVLVAQGGDDVLWGSAQGDVLDGGAGSDTIRGGAGADQMFGGAGVDIYVIEDLGDQMIETPGGGYDTAYVTVNNYVMPESGGAFAAYIEVAYLAGSAVFLNGSTSGENLVANPTAGSVLAAFGGNDILYGSDFGDSFTGGTGSDIIYSGAGADAIRFVESNWGFDQVSDFTPGAGDRLVFSTASGVTSFGQLAVIDNGVNTQVSFGGNAILLYNYLGFNAGDVQFIA